MAGNFHRLTTPGYFVASGSLPTEAGVTYDYANNAVTGTPSFADNAKIGGPNDGTYFVGFGENATSNNVNRGFKALAQNCDHLDDILHKSIALPVRTASAVAGGGGVSTVVLSAGTYLGPVGTANNAAGLAPIFEILDGNDEEIQNGGNTVRVASVNLTGGDAVGGNSFSDNTVQIVISPAIPAGTTYRVHYATRSNLATLPPDAFSFINIRGAQEVDGAVKQLFEDLHGAGAWNSAWPITMETLANEALDRVYRKGEENEANYIDPVGLDVHGSMGSWVLIDGPGIHLYNDKSNNGGFQDPINSALSIKHVNPSIGGSAGMTGLALYGSRRMLTNPSGAQAAADNNETFSPEFATFLSLISHSQRASSLMTSFTRIPVGTAAVASTTNTNFDTGNSEIEITDTGNAWFRDATNRTAIVPGYTLLETHVTIGSNTQRQIWVVTALGSAADTSSRYKVRIRRLDGAVPNFTGATACTIRTWHSMTFGIGDGAPLYHRQRYGSGVMLDGSVFMSPPVNDAVTGAEVTNPLKVFANGATAADKALAWGGVTTINGVASLNASLQADGSILAPYTQIDVVEGKRYQPTAAGVEPFVEWGNTAALTLDLTENDTWVYTIKNDDGAEANFVTLASIAFNVTPANPWKAIKLGAKYTLVLHCHPSQTGGLMADGNIFPTQMRREADSDETWFIGADHYVTLEWICVGAGGTDFVLTNVSFATT